MSTPTTATARSRGPHARIVAAATVIALMVPVGWAVLAGEAQPSRTLSLSSGSAWLASPERGYLSLIDGSSEQVVATLTGLGGPDLDVVADGESALVADSTNGTVARVDGASLELSTPIRFGDPGAGLQVLAGDSASYVINTEARTASRIDPVRLTTGPPVNISAQPAVQQTLLADDGRLWTVDSTGDGMTWIDPDGTTGRADSRPDTRLVQVAGKPVWVAGDSRLDIGWLAADGTHTDWPCSLGTRAGDHVQLLGSARGDQVFAAVSETGTLLVADADGERCDATVPIGSGGADFGALAQSDRYVFVPDRSAGAAVVVDLDASAVVATLPLTDPGHDLELIARDGIVFYNDRDSEKAGVLERGADGLWVAGTPLQKFDPQTGAPVNPPADTSTPAPEPGPPVDLSSAGETATEPTTTSETTPPDDQAAAGSTPQTTSIVTTTPSTPPPVVVTTPKTTPPPPTTTGPPVVNQPTTSSATSTTTTESSTTTTTTTPIPVITAINASRSVAVGKTVQFTAEVTDPSGDYKWSATDSNGDTYDPATYPDGSSSYELTAPLTSTVTVSLTVGNSAPFPHPFDVVLPKTSVDVTSYTTAIFTNTFDSNCGAFGCVEIVATLRDEDGQTVPAGAMQISYPNDVGSTTTVDAMTDQDGKIDVFEIGHDAAVGDDTFTVAYVGGNDLDVSSAPVTIRVDHSPMPVAGSSTCTENGTGRPHLTVEVTGMTSPQWEVRGVREKDDHFSFGSSLVFTPAGGDVYQYDFTENTSDFYYLDIIVYDGDRATRTPTDEFVVPVHVDKCG